MRLSTKSFAGTARTLVAVGTVRLAAMFAAVRAAAPRSRTWAAWAGAGAGAAAAAGGAARAGGPARAGPRAAPARPGEARRGWPAAPPADADHQRRQVRMARLRRTCRLLAP